MSNTDGGYYAIKGFEFQIDKNILEVLSEADLNKKVNIEQTQDIDSADFVMQVKYKEASKFVPSAIKEPVIQLIDEYKANPNRNYILYCFFGDWNGYTSTINLDDILGNTKDDYTSTEKTGFQSKFKIEFALQFDLQLEKTIEKIIELGYDEDNAIIHHSRLTQHLRNLVINNNQANATNRFTTKKEFIELIKSDRQIIYTSAYREYKGDKAYFIKLKKQYFTFRNLDKYFRIFIIETTGQETIAELKQLTIAIINKYHKKTQSDIKGEAPFIYFTLISKDNLVNLKSQLLSIGKILKDGFDFENSPFNINSILIKASRANMVCLKIINDYTYIEEILKEETGTSKEIYQFFCNNPLSINHSSKEVKIKVKALSDISQILN